MQSHILPRKSRSAGNLATVFRAVVDHLALHRSRQRLAVLDDHLLADIGVSRDEAMAEATRSAWNAPDHWHR
jgi:uncharacterized protein YjiS (DUF1127 family)